MSNTFSTVLDPCNHTIENPGGRYRIKVSATSIAPFALAILPGRVNGADVRTSYSAWPYKRSDGMTGYTCELSADFDTDNTHDSLTIGSFGLATVIKTISVRPC